MKQPVEEKTEEQPLNPASAVQRSTPSNHATMGKKGDTGSIHNKFVGGSPFLQKMKRFLQEKKRERKREKREKKNKEVGGVIVGRLKKAFG